MSPSGSGTEEARAAFDRSLGELRRESYTATVRE